MDFNNVIYDCNVGDYCITMKVFICMYTYSYMFCSLSPLYVRHDISTFCFSDDEEGPSVSDPVHGYSNTNEKIHAKLVCLLSFSMIMEPLDHFLHGFIVSVK
uniref:Uncharacterized protein n=1 Tax=Nelumbo nucifera TaxID=4432 RepID=A0A822XN37_NELNU|nr:TPA_asm: hypothetical protein HUJ06_024497 [Nelumbo nucifera]